MEGTDRLLIDHNLIGDCRSTGFYAKPVLFRMSSGRGGTSVRNTLQSNIFYHCQEAAITFPTRDNVSDGNLFALVPAGFLRVMYPEPEICLDLPAWQEFVGLDVHSSCSETKIVIDREAMLLEIDGERISLDPRIQDFQFPDLQNKRRIKG